MTVPPNRRCSWQARGVAAASGGLILKAEPPSVAAIVGIACS